jgi:hypothetical protein
MSRFSNMKLRTKIAVGATLGAAVLGGGGMLAFAYFTANGTGTGSATAGSASPWTVTSAAPTGNLLVPDAGIGGTNVETIAYTVKNAGSGNQSLNQVVISVTAGWSAQANNAKPACNASDFSIEGTPVNSSWTDTSLAGSYTPNATQTGHVTIEMIDNSANQDNCQGVTVPLTFSAS